MYLSPNYIQGKRLSVGKKKTGQKITAIEVAVSVFGLPLVVFLFIAFDPLAVFAAVEQVEI